MISAYYTLKDGFERFYTLEKVFKKQIENPKDDFKLNIMVNNVKEAFTDFYNGLLEYSCLRFLSWDTNNEIKILFTILSMQKNNIYKNFDTVKECYDAIKIITTAIKENIKQINFEFYEVPGTKNDYIFDYNEQNNYLGTTFFMWLSENIDIPNRSFKILNMETLYGYDGESLKGYINNNNVELYGVNSEQNINDRLKYNYDRLIYGDLRGSTISNEVFDICFYRTSFSMKREYINGTIKKEEKVLLNKAIQYIRKGGYLILDIPEFKLSKDICVILAKNFNDFYFVENKCDYRNDLKDIIIIAKKNEDKQPIDLESYNSIRYRINRRKIDINYDEVPINLENKITFPKTEKEISQFRGSKINGDELDSLYLNSSCTKEFWNDQNKVAINEITKVPLLPFTAGQLGLILTSGFLDGVVHEDDTHCHVVKGRTVQRTDSNDEIYSEINSMEVTEITSNRVEINTFLPDGTFKKLA